MIKTTLGIDGMMCGMCESHMKVKKVNSSHANKTTEIISEGQLDEDKLKQVVADTGYTMTSINTEEYEKKGFSLFHRN